MNVGRFGIRGQTVIFWVLFVAVVAITGFYRFYQPLTHPALLQFDIFDWASRSADILREHSLVTPTSLWVFPVLNAVVAYVLRVDLFDVYLYSGAVLTTLNVIIIYWIGRQLWPSSILPRFAAMLFYALDFRLLARSVNYLPETLSYTLGLLLVLCYLVLIRRRAWKTMVPAITFLSYLYYHLHQSGLNFLVFSAATVFGYFFFIANISYRRRLIALAATLVVAFALLATNAGLRNQFNFFLHADPLSDSAFQGTPIPIQQIFTDYPLPYVMLMILGTFSILRFFMVKRTFDEKATWLIVLGIPAFYFLFLYVLPNLNLYRLIPWRFYTWFSLYVVFVAGQGVQLIFQRLVKSTLLAGGLMLLILLPMVHGNVISDDMFTADKASIESIRRLPIPDGSTVVTTNANLLQTRFALSGKYVVFKQAGSELFRAKSAQVAWTELTPTQDVQPPFVLISLFQLRQRPTSIDYWRTSAFFDMSLDNFNDSRYFTELARDTNVVLYQARVGSE